MWQHILSWQCELSILKLLQKQKATITLFITPSTFAFPPLTLLTAKLTISANCKQNEKFSIGFSAVTLNGSNCLSFSSVCLSLLVSVCPSICLSACARLAEQLFECFLCALCGCQSCCLTCLDSNSIIYSYKPRPNCVVDLASIYPTQSVVHVTHFPLNNLHAHSFINLLYKETIATFINPSSYLPLKPHYILSW